MEETWSTLVTSTCRPLRDDEVLEEAAVEEMGLLRNQRMAKKPTSATAMIWGMLMEFCEWSAILAASRCKMVYGLCLCEVFRDGVARDR